MILKPTLTQHGDHMDYCLRRKSGRIFKRACKAPDQVRLQVWYAKYNKGEPLDRWAKIELIKRETLAIKKRLWRVGINHQMSAYGVLKNPLTGVSEYRRYEIFSKDPFSREQFSDVLDQIRKSPPSGTSGVFLLIGNKLKQVGVNLGRQQQLEL